MRHLLLFIIYKEIYKENYLKSSSQIVARELQFESGRKTNYFRIFPRFLNFPTRKTMFLEPLKLVFGAYKGFDHPLQAN